jgi:CheY-like chemotaxis protein
MVTTDPRKPRQLKPRTLNVLVADANAFSRGLIGEILRNLDITNIKNARNAEAGRTALRDNSIEVILLSGDDGDELDAPSFVRMLRQQQDNHVRRLPVVLITSGLTRERVVSGRDAGVDEFLNKPISPVALHQRLEMVIETPRPFVDSTIFLGPCRRRKNPADYHGARRRAGERVAGNPPMIDHDQIAREMPIRRALSLLRQACAQLQGNRTDMLAVALNHLHAAKQLSLAQKDNTLHAGLNTFEAYLNDAAPLGQLDDTIVNPAITAIEQLAALPISYAGARDSVAIALGKVIQKKLAA